MDTAIIFHFPPWEAMYYVWGLSYLGVCEVWFLGNIWWRMSRNQNWSLLIVRKYVTGRNITYPKIFVHYGIVIFKFVLLKKDRYTSFNTVCNKIVYQRSHLHRLYFSQIIKPNFNCCRCLDMFQNPAFLIQQTFCTEPTAWFAIKMLHPSQQCHQWVCHLQTMRLRAWV